MITEAKEAFGSFRVRLRGKPEAQPGRKPLPATPQEILDLLDDSNWLGHVIITDVWVDPNEVDPLSVARYTGVYRERSFSEEAKEIGGSGLVYWLGDGQQRGPEILESELVLDSLTLEQGLQQLLPDAIELGDVVGAVGTQTARYLFVTRRRAIEDWCSLFDAEYEITPQGFLNAGPASSLYPTFNDPNTLIKRHGAKSASDLDLKSLPTANVVFATDAVNYATRVIALTQIEDESFLEGSADLPVPTTYRDLHGNLVTITDVNVESTLDAFNVDARAAARLAQISEPRNTIELSTTRYDVEGTIKVGDSVWVWDPESGLYDLANKIIFAGEDYFPGKLRVVGLTWPITKGMGVYFRRNTAAGETYDLTPYVLWESGSTQVEVGAFSRSLIPPSTQPIGPIIAPVVNTNDPPSQPSAPTVAGNILHAFVTHDLTKAGGGLLEPWTAFLKVFASTTSGFTPGPTNYIGRMEVSEAQITLGTPISQQFELEDPTEHFFKVQPVGQNGLEGPASTQASVTVDLIPSAAIISLVADKIAAGTITASVELTAAIITGGLIRAGQTSSPFNYWEGDDDGLRARINGSAAYTGGTPTFEFDIATGNTFFTGEIEGSIITGGTIRSQESGQRVQISGADVAHLHTFSGDAAESLPGSLRSFVAGSGASRRLYSILRSPTVLNDTNQMGVLQLWSDQEDGGETARAILKVSTNGSSSSSTATGAIVSLSATSADIAAGDDLIRLSGNSLSLVNNGTESFLIQDFQVVSRRDLKMSGNQLFTGGAGSPYIQQNGSDARFHKSAQSELYLGSSVNLGAEGQMQLSSGGDIQLWVDTAGGGGNNTNIVAWIPAAAGFRRLQVGAADSDGAGRRAVWFPN